MFKKLTRTYVNADKVNFKLEDTDFTVELNVTSSEESQYFTILNFLCKEYSERGLNVPANVARYYYFDEKTRQFPMKKAYFDACRDKVDQKSPQFEYGKKHYTCMLQQLRQLFMSTSEKIDF